MEIISLVPYEEQQKRVSVLAERLGFPVVYERPEEKQNELALQFDADGLALIGDKLVVRGDFTRMLSRQKENNLRRELLIRAAKIKNPEQHPLAIDATAGLGEDAFLLAAAGFTVQLYEYNPIIAALLEDALYRANKIPELTETVQRMQFCAGNSIDKLPKLTQSPDLILLDPMFPARQKSALVKKKFQLLQRLEQPCTDETELIQAAMAAHPRKIVIKRPSKGPYLAGIKPSYCMEGKGIRYDCLVFPQNNTIINTEQIM